MLAEISPMHVTLCRQSNWVVSQGSLRVSNGKPNYSTFFVPTFLSLTSTILNSTHLHLSRRVGAQRVQRFVPHVDGETVVDETYQQELLRNDKMNHFGAEPLMFLYRLRPKLALSFSPPSTSNTSNTSSTQKSNKKTSMTTPSSDSVRIDGCRTIQCATEASWKDLKAPIRLGPLDQLVDATIPVAVVFVYSQAELETKDELIPLDRLEKSMSALLDHYPHLSGRLQINEIDGTPEIVRLGMGVHLFAATCSERLDAFQSRTGHGRIMSLPGAGKALLAPFDATLEGVCRDPVFAIQHTRFACGSVALGVRTLHKICDADGFFQLVRDLAELYRNGSSVLSDPPHYRSYLSELTVDNVTPEEREAVLSNDPPLFYVETSSSTSMWAPTDPSPIPPPPTVGRFVRFSSKELNAIKTAATNPDRPESWVSTFEALSAHIYHHVHRARLRLRELEPKHGALSPTDFLTPLNVRSRLGLPPKYFPNALMISYGNIPSDVLASGPLWKIAGFLHDLTRNPSGLETKEDVVRALKWIALQPEKKKIRQGFRYGTGSFMISQWNKFDMYEGTVFDVPPTLVSPPFTPISLIDGLLYFLPTEDRSIGADLGAIDVVLPLSEPVWDILDNDNEFRRFA